MGQRYVASSNSWKTILWNMGFNMVIEGGAAPFTPAAAQGLWPFGHYLKCLLEFHKKKTQP